MLVFKEQETARKFLKDIDPKQTSVHVHKSLPAEYRDAAKQFRETATLVRLGKEHTTVIDVDEDTLILTLKVRRKVDKDEKFVPYDILKSFNPLDHLASLDAQASRKKPKKILNFILSLKPDKLDNPTEKLAGLTQFLALKE